MEFAYYYGPDREPLSVDGPATTLAGGGVAFHGVASQGVLSRLAGAELWHRQAHRLDDPAAYDDAELRLVREAAADSGALSLGESAQAAAAAVAQGAAYGEGACDLWNVKEGHTSSVWIVSAPGAAGFVVNVARDDEAGRELRACSERMRALSPAVGPRMARVLGIDEVEVDGPGGTRAVTVTSNELVDDAFELHPLAGQNGDEDGYALVERFLSHPDAPAHITRIRGRALSGEECRAVDAEVGEFLEAAAQVAPVRVAVERGDVVWTGRHAVVVAVRQPSESEG